MTNDQQDNKKRDLDGENDDSNIVPQDVEPAAENSKVEEKGPREVIEQAARDISRGIRDGERRGIPSDVPGPQDGVEGSLSAEVPSDGVDRTN